jgi:hypothetical protein
MIAQAERQGKAEKLPWILVVAGHNDRRPIVTLELDVFLSVWRKASHVDSPATPRPASSADESTSPPLEGFA